MGFKEEFKKTFKTRFISGILIIVPLFVAIAVLKFVIEAIDNFLKPHIVRLFGAEYGFPFIGLGLTIALILLTGILTTNVFGQRILNLWENLLLKIPLFKTVYSASKQLVEGFAVPEKKTFERAVLIEYPRYGIFTLGFIVNRINVRSRQKEEEFLSVFVPSTPTPFTGMAMLLRQDEVAILDISIEDGLKFVVSGSLSAPREFWVEKGFEIFGAAQDDSRNVEIQNRRNHEL